jgi:N-methylhydantoinase B
MLYSSTASGRWNLKLEPDGTGVPGEQAAIDIDPVTLAVIGGVLESLCREMSVVMMKTARSPILKVARDFSSCLFDGQCRMIAQGEDVPAFIGAMVPAAKETAKYFGEDIYPGDVLYCNDPTFGSGHLPDMTAYKPIFFQDKLVAWASNRSHMMDTGGVPGGYNPAAEDLYMEGLRISPVKLYERGEARRDVIDLILSNVRRSRSIFGDLHAQIAAVTTAERRLHALFTRYGLETTLACFAELLDRAERIMRDEILVMPEGVFYGSSKIEEHRPGLEDAEVLVTLTIRESDLVIKLDSPPQTNQYFNSYAANTLSMIYFALLAVMRNPKVPHNEGLYRPLAVDLGPPGSRVNAELPAPCAQATGAVAETVFQATTDALSKALPERACAGWSRPYISLLAGTDPRTNEHWSDFLLAAGFGGAGAAWGLDGWDAVGPSVCAGACTAGNAEALEYAEPIRVWSHELRTDSASSGRWRGGLGVVYETELLGDVSMTTICDGTKFPPASRLRGDAGQVAGKLHRKWVLYEDGRKEEALPQAVVKLPAGARILSHTAGGGGVGDPLDRDVDAVHRDVRNGVVSVSAARDEYGVVIHPHTLDLDVTKTVALRSARRRLPSTPLSSPGVEPDHSRERRHSG